MNVYHHHTPARVQVYHGRRRISRKKKFEKPKSRHAAKSDSKKRKPCPNQKCRYQHAAIKILSTVSPPTSGADLGGVSPESSAEIQPCHPGIIFRHYLQIEEYPIQKLNDNNQAYPKVAPLTSGEDAEAGGLIP